MTIDVDKIAQLAYQIWEANGRRDGSSHDDWRQAELQLQSDKPVDESSRESFPASDAPASHLPDVPPSNTDAKWAAAATAKTTVRRSSRKSG